MNSKDRSPSTSEHAWATEAIFEYLNQALPKSERARFDRHLTGCSECRSDVEFERRVMSGMQERPLTEYVPHASLKALNARIDAQESSRGVSRLRLGGEASRGPRYRGLLWLAVGQAAAIAVLAFLVWRPGSAPDITTGFRTLSTGVTSEAGTQRIQVVFDDDLSAAELRGILLDVHASIVSGPTEAGLFELRVSPHSHLSAVDAVDSLRAHPKVAFATVVAE